MNRAAQKGEELPRRPIAILLKRCIEIFKAAWERQDELAGPRRMHDEIAFLPANLVLEETPPHPAPRRTAIAICLLLALAILWACVGSVDIVAVAQGRIVVNQRSKTIQPLEVSVVNAIHVKDGDKVKAGELLIELDNTHTEADSARLTEEREAALSAIIRSQALLAALSNGARTSRERTGHIAAGGAAGTGF